MAVISISAVYGRIRHSKIGMRFILGAAWGIGGAIVGRLCGVASGIVVARMIGAENFGKLGILQSTIGMFGVVAGLGLGMTATKYVAEFRHIDPIRAGRIIALTEALAVAAGVICSLIIICTAPYLAEHVIAEPHLVLGLRVGSLLVLFGAINGTQLGAMMGLEGFRLSAWVSLLTGIIGLLVTSIVTYFYGLIGAVISSVASLALTCVLTHHYLRVLANSCGITILFNELRKELPILWSFSLPALFTGLLTTSANWIGNTILVNHVGGYAQMGLFNAANQWRMAVLFVPNALGGVVLSLLSSVKAGAGNREHLMLAKASVLANFLAALMIAGPLMLMSSYVLGMYGKDFHKGSTIFILLISSALIIAVNNTLSRTIASSGRMWLEFSSAMVWTVTYIILVFFFVPKSLAIGLAYCALISAIVQAIYQWTLIRFTFRTS